MTDGRTDGRTDQPTYRPTRQGVESHVRNEKGKVKEKEIESESINRQVRFFSCGHATLQLAVSVGRSVRPSVRHIFEFRAVFALLLLPNRPRLDCRVSGLVYIQLNLGLIHVHVILQGHISTFF